MIILWLFYLVQKFLPLKEVLIGGISYGYLFFGFNYKG